MAGLICLSLNAQRLVQPGVQIVDRFKANVPSLVVKANPLTLPFGYFDAGVEYRTALGLALHTHGSQREQQCRKCELQFQSVCWTQNYGRLEFDVTSWQNPTMWNANRKLLWITMNAGFTNYKFTDGYYYDDLGEVVLLALQDASRIDTILAAERGRTRNWVGPNSIFTVRRLGSWVHFWLSNARLIVRDSIQL